MSIIIMSLNFRFNVNLGLINFQFSNLVGSQIVTNSFLNAAPQLAN